MVGLQICILGYELSPKLAFSIDLLLQRDVENQNPIKTISMSHAVSKYPLVDAAAKHLWSKDGQEVFKQYFDRHAPLFVEAPIKEQSGEQDLEYWELFQEYLKLYEDYMGSYVESLDATVEDFYMQLADVQEDKNIKDKKLVHFVSYMVGCVDYPAFYKMMVRAAKRYNKEIMADAKASARAAAAARSPGPEGLAGISNDVAESKGDSKSTDDGTSGGKGGPDDSYNSPSRAGGSDAKADYK